MDRITEIRYGYTGNKKACVYHDTGIMVVDQQWWQMLPASIQRWCVLHESKHLELDSQDEILVNTEALIQYSKEGGDVSEVVRFMEKTLDCYIASQREILNHIKKVANMIRNENGSTILEMDAPGSGGPAVGLTDEPNANPVFSNPVNDALSGGVVKDLNTGLLQMDMVNTGGIKAIREVPNFLGIENSEVVPHATMPNSLVDENIKTNVQTLSGGGSGGGSGSGSSTNNAAVPAKPKLIDRLKQNWVWLVLILLIVYVYATSPKAQ
jgi:hypothetical protein